MTAPLTSSRSSIWNLLRWLLVLPGAIGGYVLVVAVISHVNDRVLLSLLSYSTLYLHLFAIASFTAICIGAAIAPRYRFRTACVLTLMFTAAITFLVGDSIHAKTADTYVLLFAAGQIVTALLAVWMFWWLERRAALRSLK